MNSYAGITSVCPSLVQVGAPSRPGWRAVGWIQFVCVQPSVSHAVHVLQSSRGKIYDGESAAFYVKIIRERQWEHLSSGAAVLHSLPLLHTTLVAAPCTASSHA